MQDKHPSFSTILLLTLAVSAMVISFNTGISFYFAELQTLMFFDRYINFLENIAEQTSITVPTDQYTNEIAEAKKLFDFSKLIIGHIVLGIVGIALFVVTYFNEKRSYPFNLFQLKLGIANDTLYPLLMALVFSVGIAFNFALSFLENSSMQNASVILSSVEPFAHTRLELDDESLKTIILETITNKQIFVMYFFLETTRDFLSFSISQTYFFSSFVFLVIGYVLNKKNYPMIGESFFLGTLIGIAAWGINEILKSVTI